MGQEARDAEKGLLELDEPGGHDVDEGDDEAASGVETSPNPTLIPAFDPSKYAEDSEIRGKMATITDEVALEHARLQSLPSHAPPPRKPMSTVPGPLVQTGRPSSRDSSAEIDAELSDLDSLGADEQIAILSDRLAPLTRVPTLARELAQLGSLLEDPKTAYVLGFVDGLLPLETIVDVTGLPELDTLRVLDRMIVQGVVVFKPSGH